MSVQKARVDHANVMKKIIENYRTLEESIVNELNFVEKHPVTIGSFRERIWKELFEQIIPQKFAVEQSVFIIDSSGKVSSEVDLVIFDEQYTPYIFQYRNIKYIPIEAVMVVVQCKSTSLVEEGLRDWVESIECLRTSLYSVARMYSHIAYGEYGLNGKMTQTSTRPLQILCHTKSSTSEGIENLFDIVIHPSGEKLNIQYSAEKNTLGYWHDELNHVKDEKTNKKYSNFRRSIENNDIKDMSIDNYKVMITDKPETEVTLLSLVFQLNQLLMLINNPIQFPHFKYAEMFSEHMVDVSSE